MQFNFPPGLHGLDLLPTTWTKEVNTGKLIDEILGSAANETTKRFIEARLAGFSSTYQRYFAGQASYGNPNALLEGNDQYWPNAEPSRFGNIEKALHVGLDKSLKPAFTVAPDALAGSPICSFWANVAAFIGNGKEDLQSFDSTPRTGALVAQPEL